MLRIGEFSYLSQVTIHTLRHYDDLGLLKPVHIDPNTGYRYYTLEQLPRLNRILALKDLGLPLEQIGHVLDQTLTAEEIRGMLRLKQAELIDKVQDTQRRLERVSSRLKHIELEGKMPDQEVILKTVDPIPVAYQREQLPTWNVAPAFERMYGDVHDHIIDHGAKCSGAGISIWHHSHTDEPQTDIDKTVLKQVDIDIETALPYEGDLTKGEKAEVRNLPKEEMASVVYKGPYNENLANTKRFIFTWIADNGYRLSGPVREVYLHHDPKDAQMHITEIQFPIQKL